jgi:tetratricopeptide (TPR) repeat protein
VRNKLFLADYFLVLKSSKIYHALNLRTGMRKLILMLLITAVYSILNNAEGQTLATTDSVKRAKATQQRINDITLALKNGGVQVTDKPSMYVFLGNEEVSLKHYGKAVIYYSNALAINPNLGLAYLNRGDAFQKQKDYQKAKSDFTRAVAHLNGDNANQAIAYYDLALIYRLEKQYDKAIAQDSIAIALNPGYAAAYCTRGDLYAIKGKYQLGINDLTVSMYGFQDKPLALSFLLVDRGDMKRALKQYKEAINDYSLGLKLNPQNGHAYWNQAACYNANRDYQLAYEGYNNAIPYFKNNPKSLARLFDDRALMEIGLQKYKEAVADDSVAISLDTAFEVAHWNMANAHSQNGDYALSNTVFIKTMHYYLNNSLAKASIYSAMAHNEYFLKNYPKAIDYCTQAIALNTPNWSAYFERGRAYLKTNSKELAINDFKQILALDTSKLSADYAFSLYYTGSPDKAVEVMQSSFLKTTDTFVLMGNYYNMACLYSIMNKPEDANNFLKKCIDSGYNRKYALTDSDFDNIRNTNEFKNTMESK